MQLNAPPSTRCNLDLSRSGWRGSALVCCVSVSRVRACTYMCARVWLVGFFLPLGDGIGRLENSSASRKDSTKQVADERGGGFEVLLIWDEGWSQKPLSLATCYQFAPRAEKLMRCCQGRRLRCTEICASSRLAVGSVEPTSDAACLETHKKETVDGGR